MGIMNRFLLFVVLISLTSSVTSQEAGCTEAGKPVKKGETCVSCAEKDPEKPFWNEGADTKACEACPDGKEWKNNKCEAKAKEKGKDKSGSSHSEAVIALITLNVFLAHFFI